MVKAVYSLSPMARERGGATMWRRLSSVVQHSHLMSFGPGAQRSANHPKHKLSVIAQGAIKSANMYPTKYRAMRLAWLVKVTLQLLIIFEI
jgi:hypothetical protein